MNKLSYIMAVISCVFLLWVGISWLDVIADNIEPEPRHSELNFFVIFTNFLEENTQ